MVLLLPKVSSFGEQFGAAIGGGLGSGLSEGLQQSLENKAIKKQLGIDLSGVTNPETRQTLIADQLKYGRQLKQSQALADAMRGGGEKQPIAEEEPAFKQELPEFLGKPKKNAADKFFPSNIGPQEAPGNAPQPETEGLKRRLLNPEERIDRSQELTQKYLQAGIPITPSDALKLVDQEESQKEAYNKQVEADIQQRVTSQNIYGQRAEEKITKLMPNATDEQKAFFRKKGEEISRQSKSEADIDRFLAAEARKFKNTIANVKESIPPPRLLQKIKASILGTDREFEKTKRDIRIKLKPLLNEGLYDTARNILSELGYHPEERESIITDLGEFPKKIVSQLPKMEKPEREVSKQGKLAGITIQEAEFSPEDREQIQNNLAHVLASDPATNLILLRKAYEEKGIDWQTFKDLLNNLIDSGEFIPNDDQFSQLNTLDSPPLDNLDKILHGLKLIGR